jgi:hypothetical protein
MTPRSSLSLEQALSLSAVKPDLICAGIYLGDGDRIISTCPVILSAK